MGSDRICCAHCLEDGPLAYEGADGSVCIRCARHERNNKLPRCACKAEATCVGPANELRCGACCDHSGDCEMLEGPPDEP